MSHTKGPWSVTASEIYSVDNDARVAQVFSGTDSQGMLNKAIGASESDSNAYLIAAAPELLSFAQFILKDSIGDDTLQRMAKSVIAKAKGEV